MTSPDIIEAVDTALSRFFGKDRIVDPALAEAVAELVQARDDKTAELLKNPAAVRVNYLRGGIACQTLIDEAIMAERDRCAKIAEGDDYKGHYRTWPFWGGKGNRANESELVRHSEAIAKAIRGKP